LLASLYQDYKQYGTEAIGCFKKALQLNPTAAAIWNDYGSHLSFNLQMYAEGEEALRRAIALDPANIFALRHLAQLLGYNLHRYNEAERIYRRAIDCGGPELDAAWNNLGFALVYFFGKLEEGQDAYLKGLNIDATDCFLLNNLADLNKHYLFDNAEAERLYSEAEQGGVTNIIAISAIARSLMTTGHWDIARDHIRRVSSAGSNYQLESAWDSILDLFHAAIGIGKAAEVLEILDDSTAHDQWRPLREAIASTLVGSEYLNGIAPEIREPAVEIRRRLNIE
jgi:tetratricopeptide (TPR) repeat protein